MQKPGNHLRDSQKNIKYQIKQDDAIVRSKDCSESAPGTDLAFDVVFRNVSSLQLYNSYPVESTRIRPSFVNSKASANRVKHI